MTSPEVSKDPNEKEFSTYLQLFNEALGDMYELPELHDEPSAIRVGYVSPDALPRITPRTNSIQRVDGGYSLNMEDLELFEDELMYLLASEPCNDRIAPMLFVGLGVAGSVTSEILHSAKVNPLKTGSHAEEVRNFFASHTEIDKSFQSIFKKHGEMKGLAMTSELDDDRAMVINGLRMRFRFLFDANRVSDIVGIEYDRLIEIAREQIAQLYERDHEYYTETLTKSIGQDPELAEQEAEQMFFNALPDWLIALACPLRHREFSPLFSPGWRH